MENKNQDNSSVGDEEKNYEKSLEENRQRIISGEVKTTLNPENELKGGKKEEMIASAKSKPKIETTLPPKELLDERESEFSKSEIKNTEIKNGGIRERIAFLKNKRSRKPIILGLVLGLFIIVILVGLYLFGGNIFKKDDPREIIKFSLETMNGVESYAFEGDFNLKFINSSRSEDMLPPGEESFSLAMKFDGQADEGDADNIKSSFNIKPEITISEEGGSEDISLNFSMKSLGKIGEETAYFKLNDFDLGAAGMMYGEMIIPYKNKWYSLDTKELQEMGGAAMEKDFNPEEIMEKIKELSKKYEMIKFEKDLGDGEINGQKVYHYQVGIDSEATLDFCVELLEVTAPIVASDKLAVDDVENFKAELEKNKEEILAVMDEILTNIKTEIWIGKKDKMIYKMAMSGKFDKESLNRLEEKIKEIEKSDLAYEGDNDFGELSFDMSITMSDFNQPVEISEPEEAEDLMRVLEEAMAGFMGGIAIPAVGPELDSDGDGLTDVMEDFYKTDKDNPDTDGDGYLDGDEVESGYDPLVAGDIKLDYEEMFE